MTWKSIGIILHCTKFGDFQAKGSKDIEQTTSSLTLIFDHVTWTSIGVIYSLGASNVPSLATFKQSGQNILSGHYLFVCLEFFLPLENFSLIWRRHHCRWRAANFNLCLALMAIEQWGFLGVPHLLWHGASVYNCYLRRSVTLTRLAVELF